MTAPRYLVIACTDDAERRHRIATAERRSQLTLLWTGAGVAMMGSPGSQMVETPSGIVFGWLFERYGPPVPVRSIQENHQTAMAEKPLQTLIRCYWGGYVSLDVAEIHPRLFRDPSGQMPAYVTRQNQSALVASDLALLRDQVTGSLTLDPDYIAWHLQAANLRRPETAFKEVWELEQGHSLRLDADLPSQQVWSPWDHVEPRDVSAGDAAERLARVVRQCVLSWANCFEKSLLELSGGLDSSIMAACLDRHRERILCQTLFTNSRAGDERSYAQAAANDLALPLIESELRVEHVDRLRSNSAHLPRPIGRAFAQSFDRLIRDASETHGANAVMFGVGGDNVFCASRSGVILADRLLSEGFGIGAWRTLRDISSLANRSLWRVGRHAIRRAYFSRREFAWEEERDFLQLTRIRQFAPYRHAWLEAPSNALPGKAMHIARLLGIQNFVEGYDRSCFPVRISPLLSQPVVEFCLSIPTWMWCLGGQDRAIARRAFAGSLPSGILQRSWKGGPEEIPARLYQRDRKQMLEILAGGFLDDHRIIDLPAIRTYLIENPTAKGLAAGRIQRICDTEIWIRSQL